MTQEHFTTEKEAVFFAKNTSRGHATRHVIRSKDSAGIIFYVENPGRMIRPGETYLGCWVNGRRQK